MEQTADEPKEHKDLLQGNSCDNNDILATVNALTKLAAIAVCGVPDMCA
jgi:hypothetical protein